MNSIALPSIVSPRQHAFAAAFSQASPMPPGAPTLHMPEMTSFSSPRVHYGKGAANSPRYHSHFNSGGTVLKAGTRMGWWPSPSGAWNTEEPSHHRF